MSLVNYAITELNRMGHHEDDDMDGVMRKHLLHMVKEFADAGHSGFSANYAIRCLERLLSFKPLTPLTGEDDEWGDVSEVSGRTLYQNKRCSSIFKEGKDGEAYNIDGKVFWEWFVDETTGEKYKSHYTNRNSRTPVTFPYIVPDEPIYEYRRSGS